VSIDRVLSQRSPSFSLDVPPGPEENAEPASGVARASSLRRGALHVLRPPFAPAFLLALLATCASLRAALLASSAFAAAVVAGLALGAGGVFMPGAGVLGAAIALSLVYAGIDASASPDADARWRVALPFGVVHGLGWAAALQAGSPGGLAAFGAGALLVLAAMTAALVPATRWATTQSVSMGVFSARRLIGAAVAVAGAIGLITGRT
jgi:hypothetical protein